MKSIETPNGVEPILKVLQTFPLPNSGTVSYIIFCEQQNRVKIFAYLLFVVNPDLQK